MTDPDANDLASAARGDRMAANRLISSLSPGIYALARRLLRDGAEAEDVVQESFMRLWRAAPDWRPGGARVSTWLYRVALNQCYDRLRKSKPVYGDPPELADDADNPAQSLHLDQLSRRVRLAVDELPPRQKAAIALCHFEGLGNIEAAEILEISVEALESLLSRGRRALRAGLQDERGIWLETMAP